MATTDQRQFEQLVHDALAHYADSAWLQASPLLTHLAPADVALDERIGTLREALRASVEALRPPEGVPPNEPEWLPYRVLWARCIQRQGRGRICQELALSRATYYRYQAQGMACAARALSSRYGDALTTNGPLSAEPASTAGSGAAELALEEAVRLAQSSRRERVDLSPLLGEVEGIVAGLLRQSGLGLDLQVRSGLPPVLGDPTVLRQIFVNLLAGAASLASASSSSALYPETLYLVADEDDGSLLCRLEGVAAGDEPLEFRIARQLVAVYGGGYSTVCTPCGQTVRLTLPVARPVTILLVDDDQDALNLYRRYLGRAGYCLEAMSSGELLMASLQATTPDLILLDVLMPREDGWLILQRLRTMPETARIPVIVSSVLAHADLALTLGAQGVVSKPISQSELLSAVRSVLAGSADSP